MADVFSSEEFESKYTYPGSDLGALWSREKTRFRLWAPTAKTVAVKLYRSGTPGADDLLEMLPMTADVCGTWLAEKEGDLSGVYYTYLADGCREACDPYARTTGVNGCRGMIMDLSATDPKNWAQDPIPHRERSITDAVIYELHLRDLSTHHSSGIVHTGKYLGLTERGTVTPQGIPTGLDHILALGVTHVHLLPVFDFGSVDEAHLEENRFNWGYDPVNFNVPEGSYSTDPANGAIRVMEMKQMVSALHQNGVGVIMDVVYNHVYDAEGFCFNRLVPGYFTRPNSNGSGCGCDTATERSMVRKYIVDSMVYWAKEYHIDGFRLDLAGLMDTDTVNAAMDAVRAVRPSALFYGEGWSMPTTPTKSVTLCTQANASLVPGFAFFNDTMCNALRGNIFDEKDKGFVSGAVGHKEALNGSFLGMPHWCKTPLQCVNYAACHDNMTLFDRLTVSNPELTFEQLARQNRLSAAIVLLAQGMPFLLSGEEMLRSKPLLSGGFDHNSYRSPDRTNCLKWDNLSDPVYRDTLEYYKGLIAFRKSHPMLRQTSGRNVYTSLRPMEQLPPTAAGFHIRESEEKGICILFNAAQEPLTVTLPDGQWDIRIQGVSAGCGFLGTARESVTVEGVSALVLTQGEIHVPEVTKKRTLLPLLGAAAAAGLALMLLNRKKHK
ncbi:MAG: type I pullulanase [Oscillospiraceae bacterium]|nr:type I pullulanase [Oscillospiraceae bacterium]